MIAKAIANWTARDASIPKRDDTLYSQCLQAFAGPFRVGCTTLTAKASDKVNRWLTGPGFGASHVDEDRSSMMGPKWV